MPQSYLYNFEAFLLLVNLLFIIYFFTIKFLQICCLDAFKVGLLSCIETKTTASWSAIDPE